MRAELTDERLRALGDLTETVLDHLSGTPGEAHAS
jgi:hypothetical protein